MPVPENFNAFEHLQDVYRKTVNEIVRERFADLGGANWDVDLTTSRGNLRHACTHQDTDSGIMTQMRTQLLYLVLGESQSNMPPMYTIPSTYFHQSVEFQPQITLCFRETKEDAAARNRYPIRAEVSYRLLDENLSMAQARTIANKIKDLFAQPKFYFDKGTTKFSYRDKARGYQFVLTCQDEADARKIIEQVLDLNGHSPEWERLTDSQANKAWGTVKTKIILSKSTKLPVQRPTGRVYFTHAELMIWGMTRNLILVDTSRRFQDALVYA